MQERDTRRRKITKGIPWMKDVESRCDHPGEYLRWCDNAVLFEGFAMCDKCGSTFCREDARAIERTRKLDTCRRSQIFVEMSMDMDYISIESLFAGVGFHGFYQYYHAREGLK